MAFLLADILADKLLDPEGRFIYIKNRQVTLANVYCRNSKQVSFLPEVLALFQTGLLILRGDFNIPLDPLLDTSKGAYSFPFSASD